MRVEEVRLGQRVLCMDHLSGAVKYAEVVEVEAREEVEPELLEVVLEDGTEVCVSLWGSASVGFYRRSALLCSLGFPERGSQTSAFGRKTNRIISLEETTLLREVGDFPAVEEQAIPSSFQVSESPQFQDRRGIPEIADFRGCTGLGVTSRDPSRRAVPAWPIFVYLCVRGLRVTPLSLERRLEMVRFGPAEGARGFETRASGFLSPRHAGIWPSFVQIRAGKLHAQPKARSSISQCRVVPGLSPQS